MFAETVPLLPQHLSPARFGEKTPLPAVKAKTISTIMLSDIVLSPTLADEIDRYKGPISKFVQDGANIHGTSDIPDLLKINSSPDKPLFLNASMNLTPKQAERILDHLGFTVCLLGSIRAPIGYAGNDGQRFRVVYNKRLSSGQPGLQVSFTDPATVAMKVRVVNILWRQLQLMEKPATRSLQLNLEKPITRSALEHELRKSGWGKLFLANCYLHPNNAEPLVYVDLPKDKASSKIEVTMSRYAKKADELYYHEKITNILKKITNP